MTNLTKNQKRIYDAVMSSFPSTSKEYAHDIALQGGVKYNFIYK